MVQNDYQYQMWPKPENIVFNKEVLHEKSLKLSSVQFFCIVNVCYDIFLTMQIKGNTKFHFSSQLKKLKKI